MRGLVALTVMVTLASTGASWAATDCSALLSQGYDCAVPITPGQPVGDLTAYGVGVQNAGVTPVTKTTNLNVGDNVTIGNEGMTFINAGPACQVRQVPAGSFVSVTEVNGCAAIRISNTPGGATAGNNGGAVAGGVAVAGAAAGGYFLLRQISP